MLLGDVCGRLSQHIVSGTVQQFEQLTRRVPLQEEACRHKDSGDGSTSGTISSLRAQPATPANPEHFSEGLEDPDIDEHLVCTPPLLLVAAYCSMRLHHGSLVFVPLLAQLTDNWRTRELTDVSILVAKLHLWRAVLHKETVALSALLGGVDVGDHEMCLCIPSRCTLSAIMISSMMGLS